MNGKGKEKGKEGKERGGKERKGEGRGGKRRERERKGGEGKGRKTKQREANKLMRSGAGVFMVHCP